MKLTAQRRLTRSHIQLMRDPNFCLLSGILMMGDSKIENDASQCPTAYTDGVNKTYSADFIDTLEEKELNFVVAHENFHVMYKHMTTWHKLWERDARHANMAADYVINAQIRKMDTSVPSVTSMPDNALYDARFEGWDTKRVFDYLQTNGAPEGGGGGGCGSPLDEHGWEEAKALSKEAKEQLEQVIDDAVRQGGILAGKMGGNSARDLVGELTEPTVNWRELLRDFVTSVTAGRDASTWRRPNRRWLSQDIYMPSPISESVGPMLIGIDTSGSIDQRQVTEFLSEVCSIVASVTPEVIHLLYWDTDVAGEEEYTPDQYEDIATSTKPRGGGGTDATCVKEWLDTVTSVTPSVVLMLTDGYLYNGFPDFGVPTLWGITSDKVSTTGVTVKIGEEA